MQMCSGVPGRRGWSTTSIARDRRTPPPSTLTVRHVSQDIWRYKGFSSDIRPERHEWPRQLFSADLAPGEEFARGRSCRAMPVPDYFEGSLAQTWCRFFATHMKTPRTGRWMMKFCSKSCRKRQEKQVTAVKNPRHLTPSKCWLAAACCWRPNAILLERHVRFGWCRAYLLASTLLAAVIPLLRIPVWPGKVIEVAPTVATARGRMDRTRWFEKRLSGRHTLKAICLAVYLIGVGLVAGIMHVAGRAHPPAAARCGDRPARSVFTLVRTPQRIASFSFFPLDLPLGPDPGRRVTAIVAHEASHVAHRHSAERVAMGMHEGRAVVEPLRMARRTAAHRSRGVRSRQRRAAEGYDIEHYMKTIFRQLFVIVREIANGLRDSLTKKTL